MKKLPATKFIQQYLFKRAFARCPAYPLDTADGFDAIVAFEQGIDDALNRPEPRKDPPYPGPYLAGYEAGWKVLGERQIITEYQHPSIPIRTFDWLAYLNGSEPGEPYGEGPTEEDAIWALLKALEEQE